MAMTETDIKIIIAAELKKQGFDKAQKATGKLDKTFKKLAGTLAATFSAQQVIAFGKASVKAFSDDEKIARRLTQTLDNMGLAFEDPRVKDFISRIEQTSGVLDDQLRPAMQSLLTTTGSVSKSQELLTLALDVAAGSGEDVVTVANDLSKAYVGNTKGLQKYKLGLSKTELASKSFNDIQELLNKQFKGQNAAFLETYAGKVSLINVAYAHLQETVGKSLVDAFSLLAGPNGIGSATEAMNAFGVGAGETIAGVARIVNDLKTFMEEINKNPLVAFVMKTMGPGQGLLQFIDLIRSYGRTKTGTFSLGMSVSGATDFYDKLEKDRKKAEELAKKRAAELLALQKAQTAEQAKQKRLKQISLMLTQKEAKFDLQRIQLAAAAQGKLTAEERKRVEELQIIEELKAAIAADDLNKAEELLKQLNTLQTKTFDLANALTSLSTIPSPFSSWKDEITDVTDSLNNNAKKAVNDFLATFRMGVNIISKEMEAFSFASQAEADMLLGDYYAALAQLQESEANLELLYSQFSGNLVAGLSISEKRLIDQYFASGGQGMLDNPYRSDVDLNAIIDAIKASNELYKTVRPTIDATTAQRESVAALAKAAADAALLAANDLLSESITANLNMGLTPDIIVTVNNAGSVITQSDLVESITDGIYQYQKAGKGILLSSTNI